MRILFTLLVALAPVAPILGSGVLGSNGLDDDALEVSIQKLRDAKYERGKPLPEEIQELDGKTIEIEGYMAISTLEGVTTFELVPESCECGRSKVNHFVEVTITDGVTSYRPGRMTLRGKFSVGEVLDDDGFVQSVYRLSIESLD